MLSSLPRWCSELWRLLRGFSPSSLGDLPPPFFDTQSLLDFYFWSTQGFIIFILFSAQLTLPDFPNNGGRHHRTYEIIIGMAFKIFLGLTFC
jgi:hypothetical protein